MEDKDIPTTNLNPWHPISNAVELKHLGKLAEEAGELCSAVSRCIIQGIDGQDPISNKSNRKWLEDEIADVLANAQLVIDQFDLDARRIYERSRKKKDVLKQWHAMA